MVDSIFKRVGSVVKSYVDNTTSLIQTEIENNKNLIIAERTNTATLTNKIIEGTLEKRVVLTANNLDLAAGNYFTKTITGATTLTVSNIPVAGTGTSILLDLTNGGVGTINWWAGVRWAGGTAPTLTAAGRDVLGFFTHDGGVTWTGLMLGKDVK